MNKIAPTKDETKKEQHIHVCLVVSGLSLGWELTGKSLDNLVLTWSQETNT